MEERKQKTVRFTALVTESGEPRQVILWTKPQAIPDLMRAVKENRVLTIVQRNVGTKKDYGVVGLSERELAIFLVFPKRIQHPSETKVVGIKYEAIPSESSGQSHKPSHQAKSREKPRPKTKASRKVGKAKPPQ